MRKITHRYSGETHGPITRLISPEDVGELIKPFVFLDYVNAKQGPEFGFHPHSGIATLTHPLTFDIEHEASTGQIDVVERGGVEWVVAGRGIWHKARVLGGERVQGFQLWFSLPPDLENAEPKSRFIPATQVPVSGPVSVLLGTYHEAKSLIDTPLNANCFFIRLKAGESWEYMPPKSHPVAWAFLQNGELTVNDEIFSRGLVIFEESHQTLNFRAVKDSALLFGSASRHSSPLVLGPHSVHTSSEALERGKKHINEIGQYLQDQGKLN